MVKYDLEVRKVVELLKITINKPKNYKVSNAL